MKRIARTSTSLAALVVLAACRAGPPSAPSPTGAPQAAGETLGVLAPLGGSALALWPEEYAGAWLVLEVLPQGRAVEAGDVLVRFDARAIDEELARGALELGTSQLEHRSKVERNQLEARAAAESLQRARAALERARRALEGWKVAELAFDRRQEELGRRYREANVEDQTDELDQLEKMYASDELVDATEDIVLKRSRRGLALTQAGNELAEERVEHRRALELVLETEQREEDFRAQQQALERLEQEQAIAARGRADAELRSADALARATEKLARLQRDRALFELRAPCAGLLLHGGVRDYRPGRTPPRHERGSTLGVRTELFVVAPAEPAGVAFEVADTERARYAGGATLGVRTLAGDAATTARVELDEYPRSLGTGETKLEGSATLAAPLPGTRYGQRVKLALVEDGG